MLWARSGYPQGPAPFVGTQVDEAHRLDIDAPERLRWRIQQADDGRTLQASLDQGKLRTDMLNSARFLKAHALSAGKLGVTGFCWGGTATNFLAATLGADLKAGVPFYGAAAETASVPAIKAPLLIQYAENDERINAMWPAYDAALKASGVPHEMHMYPGTQHGFHNNSTPRYHEASAKLAWERTIAHFKKHLA